MFLVGVTKLRLFESIISRNFCFHKKATNNEYICLHIRWTYDTFKKGSNGTLQMSDIYMPPLTDDSELLCNKLEQ